MPTIRVFGPGLANKTKPQNLASQHLLATPLVQRLEGASPLKFKVYTVKRQNITHSVNTH
jgi:hypothetical protein